MHRYDAADTDRPVPRPAGRATLRHIFYQGAAPAPYSAQLQRAVYNSWADRTALAIPRADRTPYALQHGYFVAA